MIVGGIEAGGTKWLCGLSGPDGRLLDVSVVPTTSPADTIASAVEFFRSGPSPSAIGIGAFGPLDLMPGSGTYGDITTTPKPGWSGTDLITPFRDAFGVPIVLDTDVNAAAYGEFVAALGPGSTRSRTSPSVPASAAAPW